MPLRINWKRRPVEGAFFVEAELAAAAHKFSDAAR